MKITKATKIVALAAALAGLGVGLYVLAAGTATYRAQVEGTLGATVKLAATAKRLDARSARAALLRAQRTLTDADARLGTGPTADPARLANAAGGARVRVSWQTMEILRIGRELTRQTRGAFDMTGGRWNQISLVEAGVKFTGPPFAIDLAPSARSWAVDKAARALAGEGVLGAMVELDGVVRCFGSPDGGRGWRVAVPDPFGKGAALGEVAINHGGLCTSSTYDRPVAARGKGRPPVLDPRTGAAVAAPSSATVVAQAALFAQAWAHALNVLGPDGLRLVGGDTGIEALLVVGTKDDWTWTATPGFEKLLVSPLPANRRRAMPAPASRATSASRPAPTTEPRP